MLNEATAKNIQRKASWADHLQLIDGKPLFSWLDLSITELCNRSHGSPKACRFCPRIDPAFYPNQAQHMSLPLGEKIAQELHSLAYEGAVILCGYGEPLLHPQLLDFVRPFRELRVELVTNGDRLTQEMASDLYDAGVSYILVSMYDGPEQAEKFRTMLKDVPEDMYALRDRWYAEDKDFGLKLTNRAGTIDVGNQPPVDQESPCFYPSYQLSIDWNGDALMCVQDWHKKLKFGNAYAETLLDIWHSKQLAKRRKMLAQGRRSMPPCSGCNATGTLHGQSHAEGFGILPMPDRPA